MKKIYLAVAFQLLLGTQAINAELQEPLFVCHFDNIIAANDYAPKTYASRGNENFVDEENLLKQLNPQMRKIYESLTPEGKALVIELANQPNGNYNDKNRAVRDAAEKMTNKQRRLGN